MLRFRRWRAVLSAPIIALACTHAHAVFLVTEPWVRPARANAATEAYMQLRSSEGATLIDVRCAVAAEVSLRTAQGLRIAPIALPLPPGATVLLAPGKVRIALRGLVQPLRLGERVSLTLVLRRGDGTTQEIPVDAEVRRRSPTDDHRHRHH